MSRQRSVNDKKHGGTLENNGTLLAITEKVADVLEREMDFVIDDWMEMVQKQEDLLRHQSDFGSPTPSVPALTKSFRSRLDR
jgi:hypothetical protein